MIAAHIIDENGFYIETIYEDDGHQGRDNETLVPLDKSLRLPKFDKLKNQWIEGKTIEEFLKIAKDSKLKELSAVCLHAVHIGFVSQITDVNGTALVFGLNEHDQMNFNSQLNKLNLWNNQLQKGSITQELYDAKFPLSWKTKNKGVIQLTETQFLQVLDDAEAHLLTQQKKYWNLESQVLIATTEEEVELVNW